MRVLYYVIWARSTYSSERTPSWDDSQVNGSMRWALHSQRHSMLSIRNVTCTKCVVRFRIHDGALRKAFNLNSNGVLKIKKMMK